MRVACIVLVVFMGIGCSSPATPTASSTLSNTFATPDALAQALLGALAASDKTRLQSLALSEAEFRDHVWPELPTSRPERNVPFEYAWGQMKQRSDGSLAYTFQRYAGKRLTFVRTGTTGESTQYKTFLVMRDSEIVAADETGKELVIRLFGSLMVKDGRYKVFSFVVDE
jgi:hypothetical protein